MLFELQDRIENFQFGPPTSRSAKKIVAPDPDFAMGEYYLSAVTPDPPSREGVPEGARAREERLRRRAPLHRGHEHARVNQGVDFKKSIRPARAARDRTFRASGSCTSSWASSTTATTRARRRASPSRRRGHRSPRARVEAFLAGDDLLKEQVRQGARANSRLSRRACPRAPCPSPIRFGVTFSHLYEGNVDAALDSLRDLPRRVQGQRPRPAVPRGLHLERDGAHQPGERPPRRGA